MTERERMDERFFYADVEVVGADEPFAGDDAAADEWDTFLPSSAELLDQLVARFEETLMRQERELSALRASLHEAQETAAAERAELETVQQILRILERDNARLTAEVDSLRPQAAELQDLRRQLGELEDLRRQAAEARDLRRQLAERAAAQPLLEQLLGQTAWR